MSKSEILNNVNSCDILFSIIDGEGKEYRNEFNLDENYREIIDKNSGSVCRYQKDMIKDVIINNGVVELKMRLSKKYNRSLKFIYYVVV